MTRACTLDRVLISDVGQSGPQWYQAGDSSIYIGYVTEHTDADEVIICATGSKNTCGVCGIAGYPSWHERDSAFTEGTRLPVWMLGCGAIVMVTHDANATYTLKKGDYLLSSDKTAGLVEHIDLFTSTGWEKKYVGRAVFGSSIASGTAKNIRILLSL